jgi:hypothetical protein
MTTQFRTATALLFTLISVETLVAADSPQRAFASDWQGRTVVIRQRLFSLVYNERGKMGHIYNGRREGLTVVTPQHGVSYEFAGRQHRDDVVVHDPSAIVDEVDRAYVGDALEVSGARKIEPLTVVRYDPGGELVVTRAEVLPDGVRLSFAQRNGPDGDDPVTSLTVRWPLPLSKSFSERQGIEQVIERYVEKR